MVFTPLFSFKFLKFTYMFTYLFLCLFIVSVQVCACTQQCVCVKVRGKLWKLVLSFYHMNLRDWTHVNKLGLKCLYLLAHLTAYPHYPPLYLPTSVDFFLFPTRFLPTFISYFVLLPTFLKYSSHWLYSVYIYILQVHSGSITLNSLLTNFTKNIIP